LLAKMGHEVIMTDIAATKLIDPPPGVDARHTVGRGVPAVDAVFICTPPGESRVENIDEALCKSKGLFVEKPICTTSWGLVEIESILSGDLSTMGACNLRFAKLLGRDIAPGPKPGSLSAPMIEFRMGLHRSLWSPTHKPINLLLDSIHELDMAIYLQGWVRDYIGSSSEDHAVFAMRHEGGRKSLIRMDRITSPRDRYMRVYRSGVPSTQLFYDLDDTMYVEEMAHFLDAVAREYESTNPLYEAIATNRLALEMTEGSEP
jgi:hypothetical protein